MYWLVALAYAWIALVVGGRTVHLWIRTGEVPLASVSSPHRGRAVARAEALVGLGLLTWSVGVGLWLRDPGYWLAHPHLGDARGVLEPAAALLMLVAAAGLTAGNLGMGDSWCMGIRDEPQPLVTGGIFAEVRHPIYAAMIGYLVGGALLVPTAWMVVAVAGAVAGLLMEAALEEDYWLAREPEAYAALLTRTNAFLPWKGALRRLLGRGSGG